MKNCITLTDTSMLSFIHDVWLIFLILSFLEWTYVLMSSISDNPLLSKSSLNNT
jgi:hypothetical protein